MIKHYLWFMNVFSRFKHSCLGKIISPCTTKHFVRNCSIQTFPFIEVFRGNAVSFFFLQVSKKWKNTSLCCVIPRKYTKLCTGCIELNALETNIHVKCSFLWLKRFRNMFFFVAYYISRQQHRPWLQSFEHNFAIFQV